MKLNRGVLDVKIQCVHFIVTLSTADVTTDLSQRKSPSVGNLKSVFPLQVSLTYFIKDFRRSLNPRARQDYCVTKLPL